ncbi:alkaline shock response membrane anchor protein AmaP [Marinicrinis lubricantis]|uniref:Alkaline shock response membrane anchor protein AmaP n=1 Tax=Marinicrinis lubricantis TaxID=2086470 RepID=A0ABW1IRM7_9BACL
MIRIFDRLLLFLLSTAAAAVSVFMMVTAFWKDHEIYDWLNLQHTANKSVVLIISIAAFLISLRFFVVSIRVGEGKPESIDQRTDYGDISISLETVENLTLKAASRVKGVKDLKARVQVGQAGIDLKIRAFVDGDVSIPVLSEEVQRTVKDYVEELTGIPVTRVSVFVSNIVQSNTFKSRVE